MLENRGLKEHEYELIIKKIPHQTLPKPKKKYSCKNNKIIWHTIKELSYIEVV